MTDTENPHIFPPDKLTSRFLDDEDLFKDKDEIENQFYNNLLARASKSAKTASYYQRTEESSLDDMLLCQVRFDDYPIWKIKCRVCQVQDIHLTNL